MSRRRLNFNRPSTISSVEPLKPECRDCLRRLAAYHPKLPKQRFPRSQSAAVLIALFIGRFGDLYVLLSQRSARLRSFAGDTSLPGGRVDSTDNSIEETARREAFEEIGLPQDRNRVPLLCILDPFLAGNRLIVTPVVVLITDKAIKPILNAPEVDSLFSHPLISFLHSNAPFPTEEEYHTYVDSDWSGSKVRLHRFLTGRETGGVKPVFGLTSEILIEAATIAYGRKPVFEVNALGQPTRHERICYAMRNVPSLRDAAKAEGIDWEKEERKYQSERRRRLHTQLRAQSQEYKSRL